LTNLIIDQNTLSESSTVNIPALIDTQSQIIAVSQHPTTLIGQQQPAVLSVSALSLTNQSVAQTFKLQQSSTEKVLTQVTTSTYPTPSHSLQRVQYKPTGPAVEPDSEGPVSTAVCSAAAAAAATTTTTTTKTKK
jgi:hypothetical protein